MKANGYQQFKKYAIRVILFAVLLFTLYACSQYNPKLYTVLEGDCADRALQIKEFLRKNGFETQVAIGLYLENGKVVGHAYVKYRKPGEKEWRVAENFDCCKFVLPEELEPYVLKGNETSPLSGKVVDRYFRF